jgi:hypothetical protein
MYPNARGDRLSYGVNLPRESRSESKLTILPQSNKAAGGVRDAGMHHSMCTIRSDFASLSPGSRNSLRVASACHISI